MQQHSSKALQWRLCHDEAGDAVSPLPLHLQTHLYCFAGRRRQPLAAPSLLELLRLLLLARLRTQQQAC